ncbi:MAG: PP2C family protein-serine/threonine phosphatase [Bacteroidota bacterium]
MKTHIDGIARNLDRHINTFQREFESSPRNASMRDLCRRFLPILNGVFPGSILSMQYREPGAREWSTVDVGAPPDFNGQSNLPEPPEDSSFDVDDGGTSLRVVHRLRVGPSVFIRASRKPPAPLFSEVDLLSLRLFVHLFDTASQTLLARRTEKELIFSLNQRVLQLTSLIDTGIEVSRLDAGTTPHHLALERAASLTNASRGLLTIDGEEGTRDHFSFPVATAIVPDTPTDSRITSSFAFHGRTYTFRLFDKESRGGVMAFDDTDQMLLDALVRQVHASLENRFLLGQSLEKQKIEQDIAVAASIQQRILPTVLPVIDGYDFAGINIPSKSVGGDYFDCIPLADGRYALVIADVSGKGVPAALLVSSLHAYLSAYLESPISLVDLARRLNRVIWSAATEDKFITAFLALLTPATGELTSVNAGHTPVYLLRKDGAVQELSSGGVPFGMLELDFPYTSESVVVEPGERLLLYTDGIPEAMNPSGELYDTVKPFKDFFTGHVPPTAEQFVREMVLEMKDFMGNASQSDDITAMYVIRRG